MTISTRSPSLLATVAEEAPHGVRIWDWQDGVCLGMTLMHHDPVHQLAFNPYTDTLVAAGRQQLTFLAMDTSSTSPEGTIGPRLTLTRKQGLFQPRPKPKVILIIDLIPFFYLTHLSLFFPGCAGGVLPSRWPYSDGRL